VRLLGQMNDKPVTENASASADESAHVRYIRLSEGQVATLTEIGWRKIIKMRATKRALGIVAALCLSLASASAQTSGYTIYNSDGTITTVTPSANGGALIWNPDGSISQITNGPGGNYLYWDSRGGISTIVPNGNIVAPIDPINPIDPFDE
jgi:hypothetical protein